MKMKTWLALSLVLACAACQTGMETVELANATVELDAFSGLPNPTWQMTEEEAGDIAERLRGLPPASQQLPKATLGYRGFSIRNEGGQRIYVTSGVVALMEGDSTASIFRDEKGMEDALKSQACARNYGSIVDAR